MTEVPRGQVLVYVLAVAAIAFLGARALRPQTVTDPGGATDRGAAAVGPAASPTGVGGAVTVGSESGGQVVVHVAGAVRRPAVYRLREGQRVADAVRRAGGATRAADLDAINLAARISDGQQVLVPVRAAVGAAAAVAAPGSAPGPTAPAPGVPLNLNTATLEQLDTLDGVGPATAQKILAERTRRGGFRSVDDLGAVPGIGPKRLAAIRAKVRV